MHLSALRKTLFFFLLLTPFITLSISPSLTLAQVPSIPPYKKFALEEISEWLSAINISAIRGHVEYLASLGTRATGYEGNLLAAQYIYERFKEYGLINVTYHNFTVVDAISYGANLTINGEIIQLHPLLPNLVCPSTTGPDGIRGQLIYAGQGYLEDFDGLPVNGSIVLMDWDTLDRWLNAARLGARAVIFLHPTDPGRSLYGERPTKYLPHTPLNFPRFYADEEATRKLLAHLDIQKRMSSEEALLLSTQKFTRVKTQNILGWVEGTNPTDNGWTAKESILKWTNPYEYPVAYFAISAYYDSGSIAPSAAPGAQEAISIAVLLELAKYLSQHKPVHSVLFVAFGAHHQGQGDIQFALDYLWNHGWMRAAYDSGQPGVTPKGACKPLGVKIRWAVNLDLSTGSGGVYFASMPTGVWRPWARDILLPLPLASYFRNLVGKTKEITGKSYDVFYEAVPKVPTESVDSMRASANPWKEWLYDGINAWYYAHIPSMCVATARDCRPYHFTPFDTLEKINWKNLQTQLEVVFPAIISFLNQDDDWLQRIYEEYWRYGSYVTPWIEGNYAFAKVRGRVGYWNEEENWYRPVANSLVVLTPADGYPFHQIYTFTDEYGMFSIYFGGHGGIDYYLDAWVINETTGDVIMAPDLGKHAYLPYPYLNPQALGPIITGAGGARIWTHLNDTIDMPWFTVFNCSLWIVYDVSTMTGLLAAGVHVPLETYGSWTYGLPPQIYQPGARKQVGSPGLSLSILAVKPNVRVEYVPLLNASKENPLGKGYIIGRKPGEKLNMPFTILAYAENLYWINEGRFEEILKFIPSVAESIFYKWHKEAGVLLQKAKEALTSYEYSKANLYAFMARVLEEKAYGYAKSTVVDASSAITFIAIFLVPFVFLAERFCFSYRGIKRIIAFIFLFASVVALLYLLHPGFTLAASPPMIIIGISVLLLTMPLLIIMIRYILDFISWVKRQRVGIHESKISRAEQTMNAFTIGVENMRRTRLRAILSLLTIIIVSSSLVSLLAIEPIEVPTVKEVLGAPTYTGLYLRKNLWGRGEPAIDDQTIQLLKTKYESEATIILRAWKYYYWMELKNPNKRFGFVTRYGEKELITPSLLGLSPQDEALWGVAIIYGRPFLPREKSAIILTEEQADFLGINKTQVHIGNPPTVYFGNLPYKVVGIVDSKILEHWKELDGEEITPLIIDVPDMARTYRFHENLMLYPHDNRSAGCYVLILPYEEVKRMNGVTVSLSIIPKNQSRAQKIAREINLFFPNLNCYLSISGQTFLYRVGSIIRVSGLEFVMMPALLGVLSLFNITLGNVYERKKYISIYSSLGLSPLHTAFMFVAENAIYAILGCVLGYIFSMFMSRVLWLIIPLPPMNYSSSYVMSAIGGTMSIIFLASLYPMFVAARMVTPSLERSWSPPSKPRGDSWEMPLPFLAADENEAQAILNYIIEYLRAHLLRDSPDFFLTTDIKLDKGFRGENPYMAANCIIIMHPVEAGIIQEVTFYTIKAAPPKWEFRVILNRKGGDVETWKRLGRNFVNLLRKQLLLWRSLPPEEKKKYFRPL